MGQTLPSLPPRPCVLPSPPLGGSGPRPCKAGTCDLPVAPPASQGPQREATTLPRRLLGSMGHGAPRGWPAACHTAVPLGPPAGAPGLSAEPRDHRHCINPTRAGDKGQSHAGTRCCRPRSTEDCSASRQALMPVYGFYRETPVQGPARLHGCVPWEHQLPA